jgi:hypothetical protein
MHAMHSEIDGLGDNMVLSVMRGHITTIRDSLLYDGHVQKYAQVRYKIRNVFYVEVNICYSNRLKAVDYISFSGTENGFNVQNQIDRNSDHWTNYFFKFETIRNEQTRKETRRREKMPASITQLIYYLLISQKYQLATITMH